MQMALQISDQIGYAWAPMVTHAAVMQIAEHALHCMGTNAHCSPVCRTYEDRSDTHGGRWASGGIGQQCGKLMMTVYCADFSCSGSRPGCMRPPRGELVQVLVAQGVLATSSNASRGIWGSGTSWTLGYLSPSHVPAYWQTHSWPNTSLNSRTFMHSSAAHPHGRRLLTRSRIVRNVFQ